MEKLNQRSMVTNKNLDLNDFNDLNVLELLKRKTL
nr:MAG TPA: hypothetical protein [Caudoviricetes sp.]